ncbi:MAG: hypothetical protein ACE5JX_07090 [Acidobacteriota bacterium]
MADVLELNVVEKFELWFGSLVLHLKQPGETFSTRERVPSRHDFSIEINTSLQLMGQIIKLCPRILEAEVSVESNKHRLATTRGQALREEIRNDPKVLERFSDFLRLWDFLEQYKIQGATLSRLSRLSPQEFKAYAFVLAERLARYREAPSHHVLVHRFNHSKCRHVIHRDLLLNLEMEGVREELERLFLCFFKLFSTIRYIEELMQRSFKPRQLIALFKLCYFQCRELLSILAQTQQYLEYYLPELSETLVSLRFGLKMETRIIFDRELKDMSSTRKIGELYSQMETALGLLKHASQQSFSSLASQLNPDFNAVGLFQDLSRQKEDSLQLLNDLEEIYRITKTTETGRSEKAFSRLLGFLRRFREGSMRALYFKDWQPIEEFTEELGKAQCRERAFILHRFEIYLSTLLGEVEKRAVLIRSPGAVGR